jgi:hypothetical protein
MTTILFAALVFLAFYRFAPEVLYFLALCFLFALLTYTFLIYFPSF